MRVTPAAALAASLAALALASAGAAQAHAHLTGSTPKAGSTGPAPERLTLKFSEGLVGRFSTFEVKGPAGPTPVKVTASGSTLTGVPARPLAPGAYTVTWRVVSTDTHHMQGDFPFTVR